jgi:pimeloyl-ACP methyl ester carboxylesterase
VGKALVIGFSQGGMLTFTLAMQHSDVVEAAFPLAGWLPPALVPRYRRDDIPTPRIRAVHGLADTIVPPGPTEEVFATLRERSFDAEVALFEGAGHEMTDEMNAQLQQWLREALGVVVERGVREGLLDGGLPPCPPPDGWLDGGRPEGGWPEGGWPEAGWPEAGWPDGGAPERVARWECPDAGPPADDAGEPTDGGLE